MEKDNLGLLPVIKEDRFFNLKTDTRTGADSFTTTDTFARIEWGAESNGLGRFITEDFRTIITPVNAMEEAV